MHYDLLLKLLTAHFLSDFFLQPGKWVEERNKRHFKAPALYFHGVITAATILILCGFSLWIIALVIGLSHILLDGAKSYLKQSSWWFIADQLLHMIILVMCWLIYSDFPLHFEKLKAFYDDPKIWLHISAVLFLVYPCGRLIGMIISRWRSEMHKQGLNTESLANSGMLIGILERLIVYALVILQRYEIIGLLIAAKSFLRFNEKDRPEAKTEYLLVGTLLSVGLAIGTGFLVSNINFN